MKFSSIKKVLAGALLATLISPQTQAQFGLFNGNGLPNFIKRWEVGFSYSMAFAEYTSSEMVTSTQTGNVYHKQISEDVRSNMGIGGFMGTYIPVKRIGNSLLAVGINMNYNMFTWNYSIPTFKGFRTDIDGNEIEPIYSSDFMPGISGVSIQMGLPVSLDFKFGAEASLKKTARWTGTVGVGGVPAGTMTADFGNAGFGFGVNPFVKGEVGIKGGILWKLRLQYTMGNIPFYTANNSISEAMGTASNSELMGKGIFSASLVLMPFSWNFREDGWWNWHR